jgi:hypothetical protein
MLRKFLCSLSVSAIVTLFGLPSFSQPTPPISSADSKDLDIPPQIQSSPTLKKWLQHVPNVQQDIIHDPSFKTRFRAGYARFTQGNQDGLILGVEDLNISQTPVTLSASYSTSANLSSWGVDAQPYLFPLGSSINLAPVIGIRSLSTLTTQTTGLNLGARVLLVPSRGGGADMTLQQTWTNLGTDQEVGIGKLSVGYAIAPRLRIATDLERWQGRSVFETRASLLLEWIP